MDCWGYQFVQSLETSELAEKTIIGSMLLQKVLSKNQNCDQFESDRKLRNMFPKKRARNIEYRGQMYPAYGPFEVRFRVDGCFVNTRGYISFHKDLKMKAILGKEIIGRYALDVDVINAVH